MGPPFPELKQLEQPGGILRGGRKVKIAGYKESGRVGAAPRKVGSREFRSISEDEGVDVVILVGGA